MSDCAETALNCLTRAFRITLGASVLVFSVSSFAMCEQEATAHCKQNQNPGYVDECIRSAASNMYRSLQHPEVLEQVRQDASVPPANTGYEKQVALQKCVLATYDKEKKADSAVKVAKTDTRAGRQALEAGATAEPKNEKSLASGKKATERRGDVQIARDTPESDRAPFVSAKCVRIAQGGKGIADAFKRITNHCATPVMVAFCLEAPGGIKECLDPSRYGLSDVIPPRKAQITADAIQGPWNAWYFVCDVSNPKKQTCLPPKEIAGAGAFRD